MADEVRGGVPVAFLAGEFDAAALERLCRQHLASLKVSRRFIRVDTLPRTALGKVQEPLLGRDVESGFVV